MIKYNTGWAFVFSILVAAVCRLMFPCMGSIILPYCAFLGQVFLQSLMMVVAPLVLVSIFLGALKITLRPDALTFAPKMLGVFFTNSFSSALIGALTFMIYMPFLTRGHAIASQGDSVSQPIFNLILRLFPKNIFKALHDMDMIGLIVFFSFLGISSALLLKKEEPSVRDHVIKSGDFISNVFFKMVHILIAALPLGVFFIVLETFLKLNLDSLKKITIFLSMFGTGVIFYLIFAFLVVLVFLRINPWTFLKNAADPLFLAFSSSSSAVTLPVAIDTLEQKFHIDSSLIRFVMPMGITMNMAGTTFFVSLSSLYLCALGAPYFDLSLAISCVLLSWMICLGTAGIPSGCLVALMVVLSAVGVSTDNISLLVGIDRFLDMIRTTLNVLGNLISTTAIYKLSYKSRS